MAKYASKVVAQAKAWIGKKESDGSFKIIIDAYNSHKPLARGYAVKYTDEWCAAFVSAVAVKLGYTDIMPTECGCDKMIELYKKLGCWIENENRTPSPGDIIFYDWQDSGTGDNKGSADHVGIVEKVSGSTITIIEGNKSEAVARRNLTVNGKYIRGYGVPKYDTEITTKKTYSGAFPSLPTRGYFKAGDTGTQAKNLQKLLNWAADAGLSVDGIVGPKTIAAVKTFQKKYGLAIDGYFGKNSLAKAKTIKK